MKNKIKYFVAPVALLALFSLVTSSALASSSNTTKYGPAYTPEREKVMQTIMENKDYDGWVKLMDNRPITQKITKDNFAKFSEAYLLDKKGDVVGADSLRKELGLRSKDAPKGWAMAQKNKWSKQHNIDRDNKYQRNR